jgi:hypothetical protein
VLKNLLRLQLVRVVSRKAFLIRPTRGRAAMRNSCQLKAVSQPQQVAPSHIVFGGC